MESGWVIKKPRISTRLLVTLLLAAVAALWPSGCSGDSIGEVLATAGHKDSDRDSLFLKKWMLDLGNSPGSCQTRSLR